MIVGDHRASSAVREQARAAALHLVVDELDAIAADENDGVTPTRNPVARYTTGEHAVEEVERCRERA